MSDDLDRLIRDVSAQPTGHSHRESDRRADISERMAESLRRWARGGAATSHTPIRIEERGAWW